MSDTPVTVPTHEEQIAELSREYQTCALQAGETSYFLSVNEAKLKSLHAKMLELNQRGADIADAMKAASV